MDVRNECSVAVLNIRAGIDVERRFPQNVFLGDWSNFLFFDSDWIFEAKFVALVQAFMSVEGGNCACLQNLDATSDPIFAISHETTPEEYRLRLVGPDVERAWLYDMRRFACASDTGDWCIYCERSAEIAVIALRRFGVAARYTPVLTELRAAPLVPAINEPLSHGFSNQALTPDWRTTLVREYASRSR